eukprot:1322883-Amorphochlora_amoeboformis.AAC.1
MTFEEFAGEAGRESAPDWLCGPLDPERGTGTGLCFSVILGCGWIPLADRQNSQLRLWVRDPRRRGVEGAVDGPDRPEDAPPEPVFSFFVF